MAGFMGGSAWKMAKDITEGYISLNPSNLKRFNIGDLRKLAFELAKGERSVRSEQPAQDDLEAIQSRNRRLQRISQALMVLRDFAQRRHKVRL